MYSKLISAINLHSGGGLTYLYFLQKFLDKKNNIIILDQRVLKRIKFKYAKAFYLEKGLFRNIRIFIIRFKYNFIHKYNEHLKKNLSEKFEEIYLNGIPPLVRFFNNNIFIFCQNRLIFEKIILPKPYSWLFIKTFLNIFISKLLFFNFLNSKDILIVQTDTMKNLVQEKYKNKIVMQEKIWGIFTFDVLDNIISYNSFQENKSLIKKIKNISKSNILFFYPAIMGNQKNHINLLKAFEILSRNYKLSYKLLLTIDKIDLANQNLRTIPNIIHLGKINYVDILNIYKSVDFVLFPSTCESYGLPLLEAKINKLKIIASDMKFVYDICNPYKVFNPFDPQDIFNILDEIVNP